MLQKKQDPNMATAAFSAFNVPEFLGTKRPRCAHHAASQVWATRPPGNPRAAEGLGLIFSRGWW